VPDGSNVLRVSYIGYDPQDIDIAGRNDVSVSLVQESNVLEGVIISTYGKDGKAPAPGAISVIDNETIEQVPIASFEQILQGQAAGLTVLSGSGQPGTAATVRIRGPGSITGSNAPLYVVDGVELEESEFATINPNDFASVAILKDASSTAIYGSRGSNGVILITTKRGRNGKSQVGYSFAQGISRIGGEAPFEMMSSQELLEFQRLARRSTGWALSPEANPGATPQQLADNAAELDRLRGINTDWSDVFFRTGTTQSHDLNVRGGNEDTGFYISLQNYDQQGVAQRSELERRTVRVNLDHDLTDKIRFSLTGQMGTSNSDFIESENGVALANPYAAAYLAAPYDELRNADGTLATGGGRTGANAWDRIQNGTRDRNEVKGIGNISLEWDFIDDFTFKTKAGMDYRSRIFERSIDPDSYTGGLTNPGQAGLLNESTTRLHTWTVQNTIDYFKELDGGDHVIQALVGAENLLRRFKSTNYTGYGLNPLFPENVPGAITPGTTTNGLIPIVGGGNNENGLGSLFTTASYTYGDKYRFDGSFRRDGSSRFGDNREWVNLWSVGGTWYADKEDFIADLEKINRLRVRASYGTTGNQNIGDFLFLPTLNSFTVNGNNALSVGNLSNPDLQWEFAKKLNLGFDLGMFNDRVTTSFDVYQEDTEDLFISQQLSQTTGANSLSVNAGTVRNKGIDVELDVEALRKDDLTVRFGWDANFNDNEVIDLGGEEEFNFGTAIIREGLPIGTHNEVKWRGVDPATGQPLYEDKDGNLTKIYSSDNNQTTHGTSIPPRTGGFDGQVNYKDFSFRAAFSYADGYSRFNNQTFFQENPNFSQFNLLRVMNTVWQQPGDVTEIQATNTQRNFSSKDIEDASFLRFRNVQASYSLPTSLMDKINGVRSLQLYAQGVNLYTWTQWQGFDPEDNNNIGQYEYPTPQTFTFGLNLGL